MQLYSFALRPTIPVSKTFLFIFCTIIGILHPSQFGVIEGRNIFSSSITLKTEYPASWDDTGAECACPHACTEKTLRKKRDRNGPRRAGRGNNQTKNLLESNLA
jgi:hypothetical protein